MKCGKNQIAVTVAVSAYLPACYTRIAVTLDKVSIENPLLSIQKAKKRLILRFNTLNHSIHNQHAYHANFLNIKRPFFLPLSQPVVKIHVIFCSSHRYKIRFVLRSIEKVFIKWIDRDGTKLSEEGKREAYFFFHWMRISWIKFIFDLVK